MLRNNMKPIDKLILNQHRGTMLTITLNVKVSRFDVMNLQEIMNRNVRVFLSFKLHEQLTDLWTIIAQGENHQQIATMLLLVHERYPTAIQNYTVL